MISRRAAPLAVLAALLLLPLSAPAEDIQDVELRASTFLGVYTWQQVIWQYVKTSDAGYRAERGDFLGGRLVGGLGLGRFGVEVRLDVAGLKQQFAADNPSTYTTLETYGAAHYVLTEREGLQLGPVAVGGSVANRQSDGGIGFDLWGGGLRVAGYGAEFHVVAARHDYLPLGGWRLSLSAHLPIVSKLYGVGDIVSGRDGYARVGLAVRLK